MRRIVAGDIGDRSSATTGARHAAASRPPWIADRCLRTVFMSWIGAPERSSSRVVALRSAMAMPSAGSESRLEPPPETQHEQQVVARQRFHAPQDLLRGFLAGFVGHRDARLRSR